jgi:hypothetical protein
MRLHRWQGRYGAAVTHHHRYQKHTDWSGLYATWYGGGGGWGSWDDDCDCGCEWW